MDKRDKSVLIKECNEVIDILNGLRLSCDDHKMFIEKCKVENAMGIVTYMKSYIEITEER